MSLYEIKMPKLGESVQEALITKWFVAVGDTVEEDQPLFEVATDKVDSEIPSPLDGKIVEIRFPEGVKAAVGEVLAVVNMAGELETATPLSPKEPEQKSEYQPVEKIESTEKPARFLSPLVKNIAAKEDIPLHVLNAMQGSGTNGRIRKQDILNYVKSQSQPGKPESKATKPEVSKPTEPKIPVSLSEGDEILEMSRMRKLIAHHMVDSVQTAPHVTTFVEADMENVVRWRNRMKDEFKQREKVNLTYLPIFIEAVAKALRDFPLVNVSVSDDKIIKRANINVGIAVATENGDLIVPVIRNADRKNLVGIAHELNDLAERGRKGKLTADEIQGGTFTITNFGSFGNSMGTPIINQPQSAILATGTIEKKPAVMETEYGDVVVVRHKMFLSLSYDHRVIDGALGGAFLKRIAENLERFNTNLIV